MLKTFLFIVSKEKLTDRTFALKEDKLPVDELRDTLTFLILCWLIKM